MNLYYHYTTIENLQKILASGEISLATAGVEKNEKPAAWVSSNSQWENTVNKFRIIANGTISILSFEEMIKYGIARIQIAEDKNLVHFGKFFFQSNMKKSTFNALIKSGKERGANPKEWFASFQPISQNQWKKVEIYKDDKWLSVLEFNTNY
jgi:hypothetical protein